jgi:hypothetical protein
MEKDYNNNNDNYDYDGIDYSKFLKPKKNPMVNIGEKYQANIIDPIDDKKIEKIKKEFISYKEDILIIKSEKRMNKNSNSNSNSTSKSISKSKSKSKKKKINENLEIESSLVHEGVSYKKRKLNNDNI